MIFRKIWQFLWKVVYLIKNIFREHFSKNQTQFICHMPKMKKKCYWLMNSTRDSHLILISVGDGGGGCRTLPWKNCVFFFCGNKTFFHILCEHISKKPQKDFFYLFWVMSELIWYGKSSPSPLSLFWDKMLILLSMVTFNMCIPAVLLPYLYWIEKPLSFTFRCKNMPTHGWK